MKNSKNDNYLPQYSDISGKISHKHKLIYRDGALVDHGPADKGPPHQHEVVQNADGSWFLAQAGAEDEEDPNHTHEISFEKEELTRAGRLLKQYRQDWQK